MKRRTLTAAQAREILIAQAARAGEPIPCPLCKGPLLPGQALIREHMHPLALGGADDDENSAYVHRGCARRKTIGTKATTAGSDVHAIAKGKRLRGETGNRPKRKIPSRPFPKGERRWNSRPLRS